MDIYYFIHLTGRDRGNTGIQRVVRRLGTALQLLPDVKLIPVRWDHEPNAIVHAEQHFLDVLALYGGPSLSAKPNAGKPIALDANQSASEWLFIPEVPHLGSNDSRYPSTQIGLVFGYARKIHLSIAVIFHDLLPLTAPPSVTGTTLQEKLAFTGYGEALVNADLILPVSWATAHELLTWLRNMGVRTEALPRIEVVPEAAEAFDVERKPAIKKAPFASRAKIDFVSWGTICRRKNQLRVIEAFGRLQRECPDLNLNLHLVGHVDPVLAGALTRETRRNPSIKMHGAISDEQLRHLVETARASVFLSLAEGFGLPIGESLWLGKPCLCSNFGSMAEIAKDGGCLTTDPEDIDAIKTALKVLATDESLYDTLIAGLNTRSLRTWSDYAHDVLACLQASSADAKKQATEFSKHWREYQPPPQLTGAATSTFRIQPADFKFHGAHQKSGGKNILVNDVIQFNRLDFSIKGDGCLFYGPYISLKPGTYIFSIEGSLKGALKLKFAKDFGTEIISIRVSDITKPIMVRVPEPIEKFEILGYRTAETENLEIRSVFVEFLPV